jgi:beta-galactosidase
MKIVRRIVLGLLFVGVLGWVLQDELLALIKPTVNEWLKTFPESEYRDSELSGAYPALACQNSHSDWGESVRVTQSLDGLWDIAQGNLDDETPNQFLSQVAVPGFVSEAQPPFTRVGVESDEREAFWYRISFTAPDEPAALAALCLHKAKYGAKVWLNGQPLGMHYGAFTLSEYDLSTAIRYGQANELIVRVGAEHSAVPAFIPIGSDFEKYAFYPGLWDSVSVVYTGPVSIVRTKVEADIDRSLVLTRTTLRNHSPEDTVLTLQQQLREWQSSNWVGAPVTENISLAAGESITVVQEMLLADATLWTPEQPFLYVAQTTVLQGDAPSDDRATRFGMRKVEWKSGPDKGFYLNNRRYYLRGTNIALHRFFEDSDRGALPWNESWVRELLSGHMKDFHWNSFRFHVGRAPNFWYDLADEIGLVVADEYHIFAPVRLGLPGLPTSVNWSLPELQKEFAGWMQENWNHASIGWWDASNENHNPIPYEAVPLVRELDTTRAWESGSYRAADRPNDPLEEHPYKLNGTGFMNSNPRDYYLADLDNFSRKPPMALGGIFSTWDGEGARNHPYINNEYGWLWLTRDGSDATPIAEAAYQLLAPGVDLSPEQRREIYAYVVSELSGYWRAGRGYAGVQHFLYLGKCTDKDDIEKGADITEPSGTCDNFIDIPDLVMEPRWARWAPQAFSPVAINIDRWSEDAYAPGLQPVAVTLINDSYRDESVTVTLSVADQIGLILTESASHNVLLPALGRLELIIDLEIPAQGPFVVYAALDGGFAERPVYSRRKVGFEHPGVLTRIPAGISVNLADQ